MADAETEKRVVSTEPGIRHDEEHDATSTADREASGWVGLTVEARNATEHEHQMSLWQALKLYPRACWWSFVVSLVVIMDGYDTALIGTLFGFPAFQSRFGIPVAGTPGKYQLEAKWQTALGLASPLGNIVGIFINGWMTERIGHKKTLIITMFYLTGCIFIAFFAPNVETLFVGELLCGLAWGVFTTLAPAYASEVSPVVLRSYLETLIVLFWGVGQLISYGVLDGLLGNTTIWAWRIPFAVQWVWPVIIIPLVIFCPESPWWYVRRGDLANAEKAVKALSSKAEEGKAKETVALMVETTELERSMTEGASYIDCFRGTNLWRTEIGCVAWLSQALVGFAITSYATYFFEQAGLPVASAYKLTVGQGGLHFLGVLFSVFLTGKFGRRPIFLWGCVFMSCCWWIVAFVAFAPQTAATGYASATIYLIWYVAYELTIGPIAFIIVAETSSTRLRSKSIALGRNAYNVFNIFSSTVAPYVLNPTQANWKGKSAFLAAGFCLICAAWSWFRLPECRGRTYEELDIMFAKGLKAREFAKYQIDHRTDVEAKLADIEHEHQE